jgi:hypothetical protein
MAYSLLNHVAKYGGGTSAAIDCSGADLIVIFTDTGDPTDSQSNSYTALSTYAFGQRLFYKQAPSVSASQTFTVTGGTAPSILVAVFSGSIATPFDQENGHGDFGATSQQPGSITPTVDNELIVSGLYANAGSIATVDSGMTITDAEGFVGGVHFSVGLAYKIQTTLAAINPTWTWTTSVSNGANIASFKAASGGGGGVAGQGRLLGLDRNFKVRPRQKKYKKIFDMHCGGDFKRIIDMKIAKQAA